MMRRKLDTILVLALLLPVGCVSNCRGREEDAPQEATVGSESTSTAGDDSLSPEDLRAVIRTLRPLHKKLGDLQPGDWLESHREAGQTFDEYLEDGPVTPRGKRRVIYIQPLGEFTETQRNIIALTADFAGVYFGLPVKTMKDLPESVIPDRARRRHPTWGMKQILSTYVLDKVLRPRLPDDAAAYIAFTRSDLWPGRGWNFVFGQASLRHRVGVWSIYRNGDPEESDEAFRLCLLRTMKTATHETGHMFSMQHCIAYECNMCGSNNRAESDRRPLALCPECLAKICWAAGPEPVRRYRRLAEFCRQNGLEDEAKLYDKSAELLEKSR